ncbi:MAG: glycosyl hydrolase family 8 [Phycisphaerae bacterium]
MNGDNINSSGLVENSSDGSGAFATGRYRNLFAEAGRNHDEIESKIDSAFQQLFHGDPNEQAVYYPAGENANGLLAYIYCPYTDDVRSEGISYGMMTAVQFDKKAEFDALWNWAMTYMHHDSPQHPAYGFFSWAVKTDGTPIDEMPAPDGEEYIATALFFAAARWGNGKGIYNYQARANQLLRDMKNRKFITGPTVRGVRTAGNLFDAEHKMIRFSPVIEICEHTDPSYHLPAFYELWARWGHEGDRQFWLEVASASRDFFVRTTHSKTGLSPDYANFDGSPWQGPQGSSGDSVNFLFDAWRTAMNWSMDWAWWGKDARQRQLSDRIQAFFESKGIADYGDRFTLAGEQLDPGHSDGLVAANAVASLAATNPRAEKFVDALWNLSVPSGQFRYYNGLLYLFSMLHCSGRFRIWSPNR